MIKFRMMLDKDKEVAWLNEMAQNGHAATGFFSGVYTFDDCKPGEYQYQIDFRSRKNDYLSILQESGIELVCTWGFWMILRKRDASEPFELYSDVDSQLEHYSKILKLFKVLTIVEIVCVLMEVLSALKLQSLFFAGMSVLLLAIVIAFINMTRKTCNIIAELTERKTGMPQDKKNNISPFLPIGLLFNSCGLLMNGDISDYLVFPVQIAAILFMFLGIFFTVKNRKKKG